MGCPKCGFENAEGVSICILCGQALAPKKPLEPQKPAAPKPAETPTAGKRVYVLIVEDDVACAKLLSEYLGIHGVAWRTECSDALQAVIQAQALNVGLVLMDIMLPRFGSGVDAYRMFRENPRLAKNLPIIFYTALSEEKARSIVPLNDPNVRLIFKPLDLQLVLTTIMELTGNRLLQGPIRPKTS